MASSSKIKKYLTQQNILIGVIALMMFVILLIIIGKSLIKDGDVPIKRGQILIKKGDETLIVNEDGLIEYRTKEGTFYQRWDISKVSDLFKMIEQKAREYLANPGGIDIGGDCYYEVLLYLDGELTTIYISCGDEDLQEVFDNFEDEYDDITISDLFDDDTNGDGDGIQQTPTPTSGAFPTSTPGAGDGDEYDPDDNYPPIKAGCEAWSQDIFLKAVITNTFCTVEPTPTP